MARPTDLNILTFDESGTGRLLELSHDAGSFVQTLTLGAPQLTYALLARYINATLVYGTTLFGGAIGLLGADGSTSYTWIPETAISDIDAQGIVGLLVDPQLRILLVQQVAPDAGEGTAFVVRRWDIFGTVQSFTFTFPASGLGAGTPELLPMGTWQGGVGIWGCDLSADGQTIYVLTRQYIYACTLVDSAMAVLVDFGGADLMANGGLACRASDGNLYAGVVQLGVVADGYIQDYSVNVYDPAGTLVDTKHVSSSVASASPTGSASFGQYFALGTADGELWTYLVNSNDAPTFTDETDRLQVDIFHGETPVPPLLMQYRATHPPGLATKFDATAAVTWSKIYPNPIP